MSSPVEEPSLVEWLAQTRTWADAQMEQALSELELGPPVHREALRYALMGPGKRLRPALVRLICNQVGGRDADASPAAVAIEMLHTYSLVHDDLRLAPGEALLEAPGEGQSRRGGGQGHERHGGLAHDLLSERVAAVRGPCDAPI